MPGGAAGLGGGRILRYLLQTRRIRLAGSGNGYPMIDFKNISESCDQPPEMPIY